MRFFQNGPSIPDALLEQQEEGNVVFLCGAGISIPAGLPNFSDLTLNVAEKLGAYDIAETIKNKEPIESFDIVFRRLSKAYGANNVNYEVTNQLQTPTKPFLKNHRNILELSKNIHGQPQIVTTNFDLLFESCGVKIRNHAPPNLPNLEFQNGFEGVVYLHGRLKAGSVDAQRNYTINSTDFGKAYMAEGWATKFIKEIQTKYSIVILGYSGEDPPMKYLLDGLSEIPSNINTPPIYAFVKKDNEAIEAWKDKKVTPLVFEEYDVLWDTIDAWAKKSKDKSKWQKAVLKLSQKPPAKLLPYQRGQVANLVLNVEGAKLFSEQPITPSADWLCVFESYLRYTCHKERAENRIFELDDDQDFDKEYQNPRHKVDFGRNILEISTSDENSLPKIQLGWWDSKSLGSLPLRLHYLALWIIKILDKPITLWWATSVYNLNPNLITLILIALERDYKDRKINKFWRYLIESIKNKGENDFLYYDLINNINNNGWTQNSFLQFIELINPKIYLEARKYIHLPAHLENSEFEKVVIPKVIANKLYDDKLELDHSIAPKLLSALRNSLERILDLSEEFGIYVSYTKSLIPEVNGHKIDYLDDKEKIFKLFIKLFDLLATKDLDLAYKEFIQWRSNEKVFFWKAKLYALLKYKLASAAEASDIILNSKDEVFWDFYSRRELLFAIKTNWDCFDNQTINKILTRIINGYPRPSHQTAAEHRNYKYQNACKIIGWLEKQKCKIPKNILKKISNIKKKLIDWNDEWSNDAASVNEGVSGWVTSDEDYSCLIKVPLKNFGKILEEKTKRNWGELKENRPFTGLVKNLPARAFSFIRYEYRKGPFPQFWLAEFMSNVNENANIRVLKSNLILIFNLKDDEFEKILSSFISFISRFINKIHLIKDRDAKLMFDKIIKCLSKAPLSKIQSNVVGGVNEVSMKAVSEFSFLKSLNSLGVSLAEIFISIIADAGIKNKSLYLALLEDLISLGNEAAQHAVCIAFSNFNYISINFPDWTGKKLIPFLEVSNPKSESAWHGICAKRSVLSDEVFMSLKDDFLKVVSGKSNINLDDDARKTLIQILAWRTREKKVNNSYFASDETRRILKTISKEDRETAIKYICENIYDGKNWLSVVKPFIENAFPRELEFRTTQISQSFLRLADKSTDDFPDIVKTILPYLTKIDYMYSICFRYAKTDVEETGKTFDLARKFPNETLLLLDTVVPLERHLAPHALNTTLNAIAEGDPTLKRSVAWKRLKKISI